MDKPLISFDYAIKYLLKSKEDYDIIEGFISALFASTGYPPVKINALLDSESNKESYALKKSLADLIVEDEEGHKYIVEIERSYTSNFMHKACFNSSRLIVDNIGGGQDYRNIKKVFHISLLYFKTKILQKPIYHGKTIIHEIDTDNKAKIAVWNQGLVKFESNNVFPEYFFISVPQFKDTINAEIDEWLYIMKHFETKESFMSKYMQKVSEKLLVIKMNEEERTNYFKYLKESVHSEDILAAAEEKGLAKGKIEGKIERNIEIAKKMLSDNFSSEMISKLTELSIEEIKKLT